MSGLHTRVVRVGSLLARLGSSIVGMMVTPLRLMNGRNNKKSLLNGDEKSLMQPVNLGDGTYHEESQRDSARKNSAIKHLHQKNPPLPVSVLALLLC